MILPYQRPAVLYVRASSEHQNYSTTHQEAALREYAEKHKFEILAVYRDQGRSGLTLEGRAGLLQLLSDVQSGRANFDAVLVYDVSRWGRFQDVDESAYYEYACRRAGISVAYCAEPFTNDGSPLATLLKGLKRAMAAEYSRELSTKVFQAQCRLTSAGFKQGGTAGYGLRRMALSASGQCKGLLDQGERKNVPTDRVTYVTGNSEEVAVVHRIYSMFIDEHLPEKRIAERLNSEGILSGYDKPWSSYHVKAILTNEKYAGTLVFNRSTQRMRTSRRRNDLDKWIQVSDAFEGIVTKARFEEARTERKRRRKHWTDDEMLEGLRNIFVEHGKVTRDLIDTGITPSVKSYEVRFNGIVAAMHAAGVACPSVSRTTITRFRLLSITKDMLIEIERCILMAGESINRIGRRTYQIAGVTARLLCTRCRYERSHPCWKVTLCHMPKVDFIIWLRMDQANERVDQYYLLPVSHFAHRQHIWPSTRTLYKYEKFSYDSIAEIFGLSVNN